MSDDQYTNLLIQVAISRLGITTHFKDVEEILKSLWNRLNKLNFSIKHWRA